MRKVLAASAIMILAMGLEVPAQDWPQFFGPERNGVYSGPELSETWGPEGPPLVWWREVGEGFSGPVVADDRLILFHRVSDREVVEALDPQTGTNLWEYSYPTTYRDDFGFDEGTPRCSSRRRRCGVHLWCPGTIACCRA